MKKNKYIISYSIQLILTLAVLGAVIWYAQIMPINTPLVSAFNFDLAQFGIIGGFGKKECKDRYSRREKSDHKSRRRFVAFMSRFCHFFDILVFIL